MQWALTWSWPRGTSLRYSLKVTLATLLGFLLSFGDPSYAMFGAFAAALVVGESRGEDVSSAANRARGSFAGMLVGVAFSRMSMPPALAVALSIGATAYVCMGCNWGKSAARIGASLCAVTVLLHADDALVYSAIRVGDTLVGIAAGLAVSYLVLPVRGRDAVADSVAGSLDAVAKLLEALARADLPLEISRCGDVLRSMVALDKAMVDARHEIGGEAESLQNTSRTVALACIGSLGAAIAYAELRNSTGGLGDGAALCEQAATLARRAKSGDASAAGDSGAVRGTYATPAPGDVSQDGYDEVARQGFALGLRKVDHALSALGR